MKLLNLHRINKGICEEIKVNPEMIIMFTKGSSLKSLCRKEPDVEDVLKKNGFNMNEYTTEITLVNSIITVLEPFEKVLNLLYELID